MQKRILALLAAAALVLSLSACGGEADPQESTANSVTQTTAFTAQGDIASPAEQPGETAANTAVSSGTATTQKQPEKEQLGTLFQTMVRDRVRTGTYTVKFKQSGMSVVTSVSDKDSVIESNAAGLLQFTLINKGGEYFMLTPSTRKYVQLSSEDYAEQADSLGAASSMELDDLVLQKTGTETLSGKKYNTETYDEGSRGTVTYFFDDTGLRKARVVKDGKTSMVDTFEVVTGVDASVFEIPADYVQVSDPGQLFA